MATLKERLSVLRPTLTILAHEPWECLTIYALVQRVTNTGRRYVRFFISEKVNSVSEVTFEVATNCGVKRQKDGTISIPGENGETLIAGMSKDFFDDYRKIPFKLL